MAPLKTVWSKRAMAQLKQIYDYLKYERKSPVGAANVKRDILAASRGINFAEQYQIDETAGQYRRIIIRHYKPLYKKLC